MSFAIGSKFLALPNIEEKSYNQRLIFPENFNDSRKQARRTSPHFETAARSAHA
jgi:hypothetical protein